MPLLNTNFLSVPLKNDLISWPSPYSLTEEFRAWLSLGCTCISLSRFRIPGRGDLQITGPMVTSIQEMAVLYYPCLNRNLGCSLPPLATLPPPTIIRTSASCREHMGPHTGAQPCCYPLAKADPPTAQSVSHLLTLGLWSSCSFSTAREVLSAAPFTQGLAGLATWAGYFFPGPPHFANPTSSYGVPTNFRCTLACASI